MTFWQIFVRVFPSRPLIALQSMWWQITGRKVRARNRLRAAGRDLPFVYAAWIREHERADEVRERAPSEFSQWDWLPAFSILLIVEPNCSKADLDRSIGSVRRQVYPHWSLHVTKGSSGLSDIAPDDRTPLITENGALAAALRAAARNANEYLVPIRSGDELSSSGLFRFAETIRENPAATVIYGDHGKTARQDQATQQPSSTHDQVHGSLLNPCCFRLTKAQVARAQPLEHCTVCADDVCIK